MLKAITASLAVLIFGSQPVEAIPNPNPDTERHVILNSTTPNARVQRKFANPIKLTIRHFPLHRIFADEDDDDGLSVAQHAMHHRREINFELKNSVVDYPVRDDIKLRLLLIRLKVLEHYQEKSL